jgi:hypothetical protein
MVVLQISGMIANKNYYECPALKCIAPCPGIWSAVQTKLKQFKMVEGRQCYFVELQLLKWSEGLTLSNGLLKKLGAEMYFVEWLL